MTSGNNGFMFFENYYTATRMMTEAQRLQFYDAIIEYGILNKEPELDGLMLSAFELVRPGIDKSIDIRERGRKGGIAKGESYKEKDVGYIAKSKVLNSQNESAKNEGKGREEKGREVEEEEKGRKRKGVSRLPLSMMWLLIVLKEATASIRRDSSTFTSPKGGRSAVLR